MDGITTIMVIVTLLLIAILQKTVLDKQSKRLKLLEAENKEVKQLFFKILLPNFQWVGSESGPGVSRERGEESMEFIRFVARTQADSIRRGDIKYEVKNAITNMSVAEPPTGLPSKTLAEAKVDLNASLPKRYDKIDSLRDTDRKQIVNLLENILKILNKN